MPTDLLVNLLDLMMRHNIFEFNGELYRQLSGVDMGTRSAPSLANIFCAEIDKEIVKLAETYYKTRQWTPPTCPLPPSTASSRRTRGYAMSLLASTYWSICCPMGDN